MGKESLIIALLFAVGGVAVYAVIHELQPVMLAAVQFTGIALIIIVLAVSFGGLFVLITLFTGRNNSPGAMIAHELIEQRRINKINALILKEQLAAKREELRNLEINYMPDAVRDNRWGGYIS